jgi:hypothetical protein
MENHLKIFDYSYGKNIDELFYEMKKEDMEFYNYLLKKNKFIKIFMYFSYSNSILCFLKKIKLSKIQKRNLLLSFSIERKNYEGVEYLLSKGANPTINNGQSIKLAHNTNQDYKMIEIISKNKYFLDWISEKWIKRHLSEEEYIKNLLKKNKVKNKIKEF